MSDPLATPGDLAQRLAALEQAALRPRPLAPHCLPAHGGAIRALLFRPGDGALLTWGLDNTVRAWDPRAGVPLSDAIPAGPALDDEIRFSEAAFRPDGGMLVVATFRHWMRPGGRPPGIGGLDSTLWTWDLSSPSSPPAQKLVDGALISAIVFGPEGHNAFIGQYHGGMGLAVLDTADLNEALRPLLGLGGHIGPVAHAAQAEVVAGGEAYGSVGLWDLAAPQPRATLLAEEWLKDGVSALALSPDGQRLVAAFGNGELWRWHREGETWTADPWIEGVGGLVALQEMAFDPRGRRLAAIGRDGILRLWATRREPAIPLALPGGQSRARCLAFGPQGDILVAGCENGDLLIWPLR
jgi:WD40 repeat protein